MGVLLRILGNQISFAKGEARRASWEVSEANRSQRSNLVTPIQQGPLLGTFAVS